jgi:hypothetical protein
MLRFHGNAQHFLLLLQIYLAHQYTEEEQLLFYGQNVKANAPLLRYMYIY